jgi:hypothetical protein
MNRLMKHVLGTVVAGAAVAAIPTTTFAGRHDLNLNIDVHAAHREIDPSVYEDRQIQVWVEPVYRTVTDTHWVEPVYQTTTERVWCPPVTKTVTDHVWVPDRYEDHRVTHYGPYGPRVTFEHVFVPGHYEDRAHDVVITPGHYDDVQHQVLVTPGHWETGQRQELVTPGHYETRTEHVLVERSHVEEQPIGRIGLRLPMP